MAGHDDGLVQRHSDRFVKVEDRVGQLEVDMATVTAEIEPLKEAVTNFRNLDKNVTTFMTETITGRRVLKEAVDSHNWRIMLAVALVGLVLAALQLGIEWGHHRTNGSILHHSQVGEVYNAHNNQTQLTEGEHHGNW